MSRLEQALIAVAQFLHRRGVPYMVIGGVANAVWGIPRATLDVDLTVWVSGDQIEAFVQAVTAVFPSRTAQPVAFLHETGVLPLQTSEGVRMDMIFGQLPYEDAAIQRAARHIVEGVEVRVCQPEDLVLHKLASERSKDQDDVRGIILQQAGRLDRRYLDPKVAELAQGLGRPDLCTWYEQCLAAARRQV